MAPTRPLAVERRRRLRADLAVVLLRGTSWGTRTHEPDGFADHGPRARVSARLIAGCVEANEFGRARRGLCGSAQLARRRSGFDLRSPGRSGRLWRLIRAGWSLRTYLPQVCRQARCSDRDGPPLVRACCERPRPANGERVRRAELCQR